MAHIDLLQNDIATNPQSGYYRVYFKSDGFPYYRNNAGTETAFTVGSLSDYVTIATPQTITGAKTFSAAVNLGSVGSTSAVTLLAVDGGGNVVNGSSLSGGQVDSVVGGTNINITTPGVNPTVNLDASISNAITSNTTDIAANTTLANSKVASVVGSTNITIGGSATAPQVDLNSAITGTSVNNVTLSDGGVATNFLNETGTYSAPTTVPGLHASTHVSGGTDIIRDATASLNGLATPAQITKLDGIATGADVAPIQSLANVGSGEDVFKQTTGAGIAQFKTLTGGTNVTLDVSSGNDITINASVASDSLQDAYDASTTPEITTDATRGALTIKRGSALDSDNVLEVQNGAGTNVVQATAEGVVTIGDLTIVGPYNMLDWTTSGNTSFIQADYTGAGILGIVSTNGVYIQADTNFGSSDVSGISSLNMSGTATIGGQILVTGPITGLIQSGTQVGLVGYDSSGKLIIGTGNAGDAVLSATQTFTGVNTFSNNINASQLINHADYPTGSTTIGNVWRDGNNLKFRDSFYTKNLTYNASSSLSETTLTVDTSIYTQFALRSQAVNLTIAAPINGLNDGQKLTLRIKDNGVSKTISWNAVFVAIGTTLPLATVAGKYIYVGCIYDESAAKWHVVAVSEEA